MEKLNGLINASLIFPTELGVVKVDTVAYGRTDRQTCSEGKPPAQLANTKCSQGGALEALANRCLPVLRASPSLLLQHYITHNTITHRERDP